METCGGASALRGAFAGPDDIVQGMTTGDDATFATIARQHGPLIGRIARSYEANAARAEDLVQDIYLSVWQALPRFRGDASLRTFVARIAHNRAISHVSREARGPRLVE